MEEELLREMVQDREAQIASIRRKTRDQETKMKRMTEQLKRTKEQLKVDTVDQQVEHDQLVARHGQLVEQLREAKELLDMKKNQQTQGVTSLHLYTEVMKQIATPESRDSSYVMRMQAQLCKAMHSMGIAENQLALATKQSESWIKFLKDSMTATVEEKSQVELKLMNDLVGADNSRRDLQEKLSALVTSHGQEKEALQQQLEGQQGEGDEEGEDNEEREELMEILNQGMEEILRMEEQNRLQVEMIRTLEAKIANQQKQQTSSGGGVGDDEKKDYEKNSIDADAAGGIADADDAENVDTAAGPAEEPEEEQ